MTLLHVALGGALGASLRYLAALTLSFPYATVFVNTAGSFVMGLVFVALHAKGADHWQPLIMTGVLGGFTTFSAFSLDAFRLYEAGNPGQAVIYIGATLGLCLVAVTLGVALARGIWA